MREVKLRSPLQFMLVGIVLLYAGGLIIAPIAAIVQGAFGKGLDGLFAALTEPDVIHAFQVTLFLSIIAALVNLVAGVVLAWVLVRHQFPGKRLLSALVDAPFIISPVIIGYVLIVLFGRQGWINIPGIQIAFALPGMLIATIIVSMPFVTREVMPVLANLGPEQEEGAYTLGANRWLTFWRIVLPEIRWSLLYGLALTFARALGEFGAVVVVGGAIQGYSESATVYVFRALNDRNKIGAYGVSIVLALLSVVLLMGMEQFKRRPKTLDVIQEEVQDVDFIGTSN
ncbi:MAG: sulfate ABC transporter permease subunit [Chloroflexota bacterium]